MNTFVKTSEGLRETANSRIKTYTTAQEVYDAIEAGDLKEGENFATYVTEGIKEDIVDQVNHIESLIPGNASLTNLLVTVQEIQDLDVGALEGRVDTLESYIPTNTSSDNPLVNNSGLTQAYNTLDTCIGNVNSDLTTLAGRVTANETNISTLDGCKVDCSDFTTLSNTVADNTAAIDTKTSCTDFTELAGTVSGIATSLANKVSCTDFTALETTVSGHTTSLAGKASCTDLSDLSTTVSGLSTTVASKASCTALQDLSDTVSGHTTAIRNNADDILGLESKPGLECTGTVKSVNGNGPDSSGNVSLSMPELSYNSSTHVLSITL